MSDRNIYGFQQQNVGAESPLTVHIHTNKSNGVDGASSTISAKIVICTIYTLVSARSFFNIFVGTCKKSCRKERVVVEK